jgi:hypothetical protein
MTTATDYNLHSVEFFNRNEENNFWNVIVWLLDGEEFNPESFAKNIRIS